MLQSLNEKKINARISWEDKNYCCWWADDKLGIVAATDKTLDGVKQKFEDALRVHLETEEAIDIEYTSEVSALLKQAERFTTMAILSRVTGINQQLLSHYINSVKKPRETQRKRIVDGLHEIGQQVLAVQ